MKTIFENFCRLNALNYESSILNVMVGIYALLIVSTIGSIYGKNGKTTNRFAWAFFVLACPFVGIALYCFLSLIRADYSGLKQFGFGTSKNKSVGINNARVSDDWNPQ